MANLPCSPYNLIMPIHLLDDEVASQIAAGEVVERPASVVKELVENALDAQATKVNVAIELAGRKLIEVSDNGFGIPASELPLAVLRHATSKLSQADDLFHISTLGFRGEALAAVGSVSRMTVISRFREAEEGARLYIEGGHAGTLETVGSPVGTIVRVENLFYNVPARLKFLKSEATEKRYIDNLVTRYALAYPQVRFQMHQDNRPSLMTSGNGNRREVLASFYGIEIAKQMLEVLAVDGAIQISGFISPTSITKSNRRELTFFVNRRPVQDVSLSTALLQAYHTLLMVGRYPLAVLFLEMPAEEMDVNVHPTKAEVKFREPDVVFRAVQSAVRRALLAHTPVPALGTSPYWKTGDWQSPPKFENEQWVGPGETTPTTPEQAPTWTESRQGLQSELPPTQTRIPLLRLVGQVAAAFLVAEGPDGLYLIDQHAAHERVLFEKMMLAVGQPDAGYEGVSAQTLLEPQTVNLTSAQASLLSEQLNHLAKIGFRVEEFGRNTFIVRAIPLLLAGIDPAAALHSLVEDFEEDETPLQKEIEARLVARICKRAAVKAGQTLSPQEQRALLADLEACKSPRTCPHGRPTMIHLSVDLLERQFGRRGAR